MIIVDTSVWIDYFNGTENKQSNTLDTALENDEVALGDLIFLEILQGFKSDKDYKLAKQMLSALDQYEMFSKGSESKASYNTVEKCAENYRYLRKKGITIRKTADVIIATFCIENQIPLLFTDKDFLPFVDYLGLISKAK